MKDANMKEKCPFDTVQRHDKEIAELKEEYRKLWLMFSTHIHCGNEMHFIDHNNNVKTIITTPKSEEEIDAIQMLVPPINRRYSHYSGSMHVLECNAPVSGQCTCSEWFSKPANQQLICKYLKTKGLK